MKRLYVQIYLTVVASLLLVVAAAGAMWRFAADSGPAAQAMEIAGEVAAAALPAADAPREVQQQALERLAQKLKADLALYDAGRGLVAAAMPSSSGGAPAVDEMQRHGWGGRHGGWNIRLPDERRLVVRLAREYRWPGFAWLVVLLVIALAVGVAAHPVVRRITRRLERLEASVNALGEGDLAARVKVRGHDEVARLATSFNRAAERIEALVTAHRSLLANASHELRTPLARIRLGVELMQQQADAGRKAELERDIAELDELIEEILTASRLDAGAGAEVREEVDLLALAAEECARYEDCVLDGDTAQLRGDPRLLRRLIRNLLENARRHGAPPIDVTVRAARTQRGEDGIELRVRDHGPGVPEAERERIFEPFHRVPGRSGNAGAGLGLSLVRQIARQHGGDARHVAPDQPGGTLIVVTLAGAGGTSA